MLGSVLELKILIFSECKWEDGGKELEISPTQPFSLDRNMWLGAQVFQPTYQ